MRRLPLLPARLSLLAAATLAALTLASAPASADADLAVHLTAGDAPGTLVFSLVNRGDAPVEVLRTDTPLDAELAEDAFDVRRTAKGWPAVRRPVYTGRLFKRPTPEAGEFVRIEPGRAVSRTLDLERYYSVPDAGDYAVAFDGAFAARAWPAPTGLERRAGHGGSDLVEVRPAAVPGAGRVLVELYPDTAWSARARPPAFNGCDAAERDDIVGAIGAAETITAEALQALRGTPESQRANAPRYARWFGPYTPARYAAVTDRYSAILGALSGETIGADCTCTEPVYAYVYPSQPYDVYLCPYFFAADTLGTDSRAGTFVHELSHFSVLGGTRDTVYGQSAAAALAFDDPDLATANADSIEYFAENTPMLSMSGGAPVEPVDGDAPPLPSDDDPAFADLPLDVRRTGYVGEGDNDLFRTVGADTIVIDSITGDADLYVFADAGLGDGSLVCASEAAPAESTLDVCELPAGDTWYALVVGYRSADYEIVARAVNVGGSAPGNAPADDDPFVVAGGGLGDILGGVFGGGSGGGSGDSGGGAFGLGWAALLGGAAALRRRRPGGEARRARPTVAPPHRPSSRS